MNFMVVRLFLSKLRYFEFEKQKKTQKKLLKFLTFSRIFQDVKKFLVWQIRWCFFVNLKKTKLLQRTIASWIFEKNTIQATKRFKIQQTFWIKKNILSLSISHHFMTLNIKFWYFSWFCSKSKISGKQTNY